MTLERFLSLSPRQRGLVHERLVLEALAQWKALQDDDLSFPEPMEFAYYAIYNFFRKYALDEDVDDWLLVSQAGSSEEDPRKWEGTLTTAIENAARPPGG